MSGKSAAQISGRICITIPTSQFIHIHIEQPKLANSFQIIYSSWVEHDWSDLAAAEFTNLDSLVLRWRLRLQCRRHGFYPWDGKISWRREWQLTPVFLPGEFPRQRSLVRYSPWSHKELDRTEWLKHFTSTQDTGNKSKNKQMGPN